MNKKLSIFGLILLLLLVSGCARDNTGVDDEEKELIISEKQQQIEELQNINLSLQEEVAELRTELEQGQDQSEDFQDHLTESMTVIRLLKNQDMDHLIEYIHPTKGVRFSPYGYVQEDTDMVFGNDEIRELFLSEDLYTWGIWDGKGGPIDLTFSEYYERFIFDVDFSDPHMIGNNVTIGTGNTINNIQEIYPEGRYVEFHFTGFEEEFVGMDWRSLRLVFENLEGTWYLVGVVHDEWTI
jgi:hypothetical protein